MSASSDLLESLASASPRHLDELVQWLRIPSVSSDTSHVQDVQLAAEWLVEKFQKAGLAALKDSGEDVARMKRIYTDFLT